MKADHTSMTPYQRAEKWYTIELAIFEGGADGPNEFAPYVPVEARAEAARMKKRGRMPVFTDAHFRLWAAMAEIIGAEEFSEPFGWEAADVRDHLLGATG